jgi:hypothetical protein
MNEAERRAKDRHDELIRCLAHLAAKVGQPDGGSPPT